MPKTEKERNTSRAKNITEEKKEQQQQQQDTRRIHSQINDEYSKYTKDYTIFNDSIDAYNPTKALFDSTNNRVVHNIHNAKYVSKRRLLDEQKYEKFRAPTIAHELRHAKTEASGVAYLPMSLAHQNKISQYDEISANITELLYIRQMLIDFRKTNNRKDEKILREIYGDTFGFYFEALDAGHIKLNSNNSDEFEKEMKFIARQTQNMWMVNFSQASYLGTFQNWAEYYLQFKDYNELNSSTIAKQNIHEQNFNKAMKEMLTIGGINFYKYFNNKDVKIIDITNDTYSTAQLKINGGALREDVVHSIGYFNDIPVAPKINPQLSAEQNRQLLLHKYFVENVLTRYCTHMDMNNPYDKKFFTKNISFRIDDFEEVLRQSPDRWQEWQEKTTAIATNSKIEKNSSKKGNDALFQKELAKIYTFKGINILDYSKNKNNPAKLLPNHNYNSKSSYIYTSISKLSTSEKKANRENEYNQPAPPNYNDVYKDIENNHYKKCGPYKMRLYDFNKTTILLDRLNNIRADEGKRRLLSQDLQNQYGNPGSDEYPDQNKLVAKIELQNNPKQEFYSLPDNQHT